MPFTEFLEYGSGPGVAAIVALIMAVLLEYVKPYQALAPKGKQIVFVALSFITPVTFAFSRVAAGHALLTFDPLIWQALVAGFTAAGGGTLFHAVSKDYLPRVAR